MDGRLAAWYFPYDIRHPFIDRTHNYNSTIVLGNIPTAYWAIPSTDGLNQRKVCRFSKNLPGQIGRVTLDNTASNMWHCDRRNTTHHVSFTQDNHQSLVIVGFIACQVNDYSATCISSLTESHGWLTVPWLIDSPTVDWHSSTHEPCNILNSISIRHDARTIDAGFAEVT